MYTSDVFDFYVELFLKYTTGHNVQPADLAVLASAFAQEMLLKKYRVPAGEQSAPKTPQKKPQKAKLQTATESKNETAV